MDRSIKCSQIRNRKHDKRQGDWDLNSINFKFPIDCINDIISIPLPTSSVLQDSPSWLGKGSGKFQISSCYNSLLNANLSINDVNLDWSWLWMLKLPQKIIMFLWLVKHGKILTNEACVNRNISQNPFCGHCGNIESIQHIFMECNVAQRTWDKLTDDLRWCNHDQNFNSWLDSNCNLNDDRFRLGIPGSTVFAVTLWMLWKSRNDRQFNNITTDPEIIAIRNTKFAFEIFQAFDNQDKNYVRSQHDLISWSCPPVGTIKINSDGSTFGEYGWAAYGGLARDSYGRWIEGFCGRIGYATPLQAELWGIRRAMKLASDKEWLEAIVETDSLSAVNLINNNEEIENHPDKTLIQDCRNLKESMLIELVHVLREGNKCADYMSKLGRVQGEQAMRVMVPPNQLVQLLKADMQGIAYMRGD